MNKKNLLVVACLFFVLNAYSQTKFFEGSTQSEINYNAQKEYEKWDAKMNITFVSAIQNNLTDELFVANLKKSQKLWEEWRDAEIETFFPKYKDNFHYGSMEPLCRFSKLIDWTDQRIKQLEIYIYGVEQGDACSPGKM